MTLGDVTASALPNKKAKFKMEFARFISVVCWERGATSASLLCMHFLIAPSAFPSADPHIQQYVSLAAPPFPRRLSLRQLEAHAES